MQKEISKPEVTLQSLADQISALPTRDEMNKTIADSVGRNEELIDSLAITVKNQFDLLGQRFDALEQKVDRIDLRLTNQLDYVMLHYARREEFKSFGARLKRVEKKAFA